MFAGNYFEHFHVKCLNVFRMVFFKNFIHVTVVNTPNNNQQQQPAKLYIYFYFLCIYSYKKKHNNKQNNDKKKALFLSLSPPMFVIVQYRINRHVVFC